MAKAKAKTAPAREPTVEEKRADKLERDQEAAGGRLLKSVTHDNRTYRPRNAGDARAFATVIGEEKGQLHPSHAQRLADKGAIEGFGTSPTEAQLAAKAQQDQFDEEDEAVRQSEGNNSFLQSEG